MVYLLFNLFLTTRLHAYLTAESLRKRFPEEDWLHLIGLLHDMGKVLSLPAFGLPQWAVVGDTFPVGYMPWLFYSYHPDLTRRCSHDEEIVHFPLFEGNEDNSNPAYNSSYGIYEPNCGLDNLKMSWGMFQSFFVSILFDAFLINSQDMTNISTGGPSRTRPRCLPLR
jgi:hypothetical protein